MRVLFGLLVLIAAALGSAQWAAAQRCTSDYECTRGLALGGNARCVGDTLIRTTTRCVAGTCQTQETSRQRCATSIGPGRCVGEYYQRAESRCDGLNGTCASRTIRDRCKRGCSCRKNVLVVFTGACSPAIGCHRAVKECPGGCSCDPEPVCRQ
ncbi:MAG: hypothetical protein KJ587_11215 [Alphaproteobacteria bacterium]|nr:hypothetical protein [Alphaproteobacteria bacterium]